MFLIRPIAQADLPAMEALAAASPIGMTSLPADRAALRARIEASEQAFAATPTLPHDGQYWFVLEDLTQHQVVGMSGLKSAAGFQTPFYSFRNEMLIHASAEMGVNNRIHALSLCHDLSGASLLHGFYLHPEHARTPLADLLSRARLLFIATHRPHFADTVISEMIGVTRADGTSPFWDAVGRVFFGLDYAEAERICGVNGHKFIAELMPQHPLYVPLLSAEAQACLGQAGEAAQLAYRILKDEGFESENYIDIFDGGPTLHAKTAHIPSIAHSQLYPLNERPAACTTPPQSYLLAHGESEDFRCVLGSVCHDGHTLLAEPDLFAALRCQVGDQVRAVPFNLPKGAI